MTSTALITEKERLYYFYIICNMDKEETCRAMGYMSKQRKNIGKCSVGKLDRMLRFYNIRRPFYLKTFNTKKFCFKHYGVENVFASEYAKNKMKQTCLERYGTEYYTQTKEYKDRAKQTCMERYGTTNINDLPTIKEKTKKTNLERYGVEVVSRVERFKEKAKKTNLARYGTENVFASEYAKNKMKQTCLDRYGKEYYTQTEEYKLKLEKTSMERYGVDNPAKTKEIIQKIYLIKKQNGTLNTSNAEKEIFLLLKNKFKKVEKEYKSKKYPFMCDFYISDLDLYIEYQGFWTHGHSRSKVLGPYNPNNILHQEILKIWQTKSKNLKSYKNAINVWTVRDPLKRKTAKDNSLNWIEFFTFEEFMKWYKSV